MKKELLLPLVLTLATVGCIHRASGTVTPKERATTYNAAFAQANDAIEQGAELAVTTGVLTSANAKPIIAFTEHVAELHKQITAILGQSVVTQANIDSIAALLDKIKAEGDAAIASGALGVKNPRSQQTFKMDLDNIYSLADTVLATIKEVKAGTQ